MSGSELKVKFGTFRSRNLAIRFKKGSESKPLFVLLLHVLLLPNQHVRNGQSEPGYLSSVSGLLRLSEV